jgi:glycosyltransferase involved in cell wall biosynthesis
MLVDNKNLNRPKLFLIGLLRGAVLRWTHKRYVAVCRYVKDSNVKSFHLRPDRVTVIHRGLADGFERIDRVQAKALRTLLAPDADPLIVAVGRLIPAKGHKYLLHAVPAVLAELPKAKFVIAGGGWLDESLKETARKLGVSDAVTFLGSRDDVPELLAAADMFVMPSLYEGAGVALVEACAVGVACIATRVGGLPEVIEDGRTGLLVEPQSPDALASAMVRLGKDPALRAALGSEARRHVKEEFSISDSVHKLEDLYKAVLNVDRR